MFLAFTPPEPSGQYQDAEARLACLAAEKLLALHFDGCPCDRCEKCRLVLSFQ